MNLKSVCLLLSLSHAGFATALGLGELELRSSLGQPLHATIQILGVTSATEASCFSLAPSESAAVPPPRAKLSLERTANHTLLHVRTPYAIHDPIAQFALISDCESRLRRDYVMLLDPPALTLPSSSLNQNASPVAAREPAPRPPRATPPPTPRSASNRDRARPAGASRPAPSPSSSRRQTTETAPRLVLSGRHGVADGGLSLRLDTNLPDLNRPPSGALTPDELSDENTALTRKLAHLQSQLVALQQRNAAIEKKRMDGRATATAPTARLATQWPVLLLILGLLIAAGALIAVWQRRSRNPGRVARTGADSMRPLLADDDGWMASSPISTRPEQAAPVAEAEQMSDFLPSTPNETTEVKDDILDQAEVYMAHGHGDLAIHLLHEHLRETPQESPVPWLLLLDLLHREGDTEGYAAASIECRRHFNINLSGHPISQDNDTSKGLEGYPHLLEQLVVAWNSSIIEDFFRDLIYDNRGGTRIGFEPGAYRDILMLRAISQDLHPSTT